MKFIIICLTFLLGVSFSADPDSTILEKSEPYTFDNNVIQKIKLLETQSISTQSQNQSSFDNSSSEERKIDLDLIDETVSVIITKIRNEQTELPNGKKYGTDRTILRGVIDGVAGSEVYMVVRGDKVTAHITQIGEKVVNIKPLSGGRHVTHRMKMESDSPICSME